MKKFIAGLICFIELLCSTFSSVGTGFGQATNAISASTDEALSNAVNATFSDNK